MTTMSSTLAAAGRTGEWVVTNTLRMPRQFHQVRRHTS